MAGETVASKSALPQRTVAELAEPSLASKPRLFYIDNMRVGLIILVVVGHMAITYGAPIGNWYYREAGEVGTAFAIITTLLLGIGASFLLGLFYMISGYFTPRAYDTKGAGRFVLDRLIRLGVPLAIYAGIINPLVTYWAAVHGGYVGSFLEYVPSHLPDLTNAAVGPLWFVEALLGFSILYALARLVSRARPNQGPGDRADAKVPGTRSIALFALGLGLATFLVRIGAPVGWSWEPPHLELAHFPQYVSLFAVGIIAFRNNWFSRLPAAQVRVWGWLALALAPLLPILAVASGALSGEPNPAVAGGLNIPSLAYSLWEGFMGVAMVITMLVWFRDGLDRQGKLVAGMSAAAYAVYVLHPLVIVPLALGLSGVRLDLGLKFALIAPLAVALCFLAGYVVRIFPGVRRIL